MAKFLVAEQLGGVKQMPVPTAVFDCRQNCFFWQSVTTCCSSNSSIWPIKSREDRVKMVASASENCVVPSRHVGIWNNPFLNELVEFLCCKSWCFSCHCLPPFVWSRNDGRLHRFLTLSLDMNRVTQPIVGGLADHFGDRRVRMDADCQLHRGAFEETG